MEEENGEHKSHFQVLRSCMPICLCLCSSSCTKHFNLFVEALEELVNQLVKLSGGAQKTHLHLEDGPEQARLLAEFEEQFMESKSHSDQHHEQTPSLQEAFKSK